MGTRFQSAPDDLHAKPAVSAPAEILQRLEAELAELWSCVGKKANRLWVWIAMDAATRQGIAFYVGDRSQTSAEHLWANLPAVERERARRYTDHYMISKGVIPPAQHRALAKLARITTHRERLSCTLRQLVSRLVRSR